MKLKGRKVFCVILLLVLCFCLTACDPPQFFHEDLTGKVIEIELVNYDSPNEKNINTFHENPEKRILPFNFSKMEAMEMLPVDKNTDFLQELQEIFIIKSWVHSNSSNGISVRLIHDDGTFEVISQNLVAVYDKDGKVVQYVGIIDNWSEFVNKANKYFCTPIN